MLSTRLLALPFVALVAGQARGADVGWPTHGGDPGHQQRSPLAQIHKANVKRLQAWPTQPLPLLPPAFTRQRLTEADLSDLDPESHADLVVRFRKARSAGQWVPPSREGTVVFPGFDGGGEWGGAAFDEDAGLLYVNANEMAWVLTMCPSTARRSRPTRPAAGSRISRTAWPATASTSGATRRASTLASWVWP